MTLAVKNRKDDIDLDQNMRSRQNIDGKNNPIKRNRTQKGDRIGKPERDSSIGPMTGMTGSELEGLSIVESDNLYDSDDNPAGKQYDRKIQQRMAEAAIFTRERKLKNTLAQSHKYNKSVESR